MRLVPLSLSGGSSVFEVVLSGYRFHSVLTSVAGKVMLKDVGGRQIGADLILEDLLTSLWTLGERPLGCPV